MAIMNMTLYEDNYGFYCLDEPDEEAFYVYIVRQSIAKKCTRCQKKVRLMKHIKICATCNDALEYGG
jgi:hypothetical protein